MTISLQGEGFVSSFAQRVARDVGANAEPTFGFHAHTSATPRSIDGMTVDQIRSGLWRWTCRHPEWIPEEGGPEGWEPDVGCVYYESPDSVVLIDPLIPSPKADRARFLSALDRDVDRLALPVSVLLTTPYHERSAAEITSRYPPWSGDDLPGDLQVFGTSRPGQLVYWIPTHGALVPGDILLGDTADGLRVCPDSWFKDPGAPAEVRRALRPLLDLPVEMVLVSHGDPVLAGARRALEAALT
jgi:hypothetical protein